ncbi:MAG: PEP-CTERM sorting domain-containing protein [Planctomycetota bacterium]|jgi:hypothetical protein
MMKKFLSLILVLAIASVASAEVAWFEVDPADAKDSYVGSDVITINLMADFIVGSVSTNIGSDGGTAEAVGLLHPQLRILTPFSDGTLVNAGGLLITGIGGGTPVGQPGVAVGEVLYSFEFHVPEGLDESTYITIDDVTDMSQQPPLSTAIAAPDYSVYLTDAGETVIHVIPEPMTIALLGMGGLFLLRRRK